MREISAALGHAAQQRARAVADAGRAGLGALGCVGHAVRDRRAGLARRHQLSGQRSVPAADHPVPRRVARPTLDETFHVGRLDGTDVVYLATRESRQYTRAIEPGRAAAARLRHRAGQGVAGRQVRHRAGRARPAALQPITANTIVDRVPSRRTRRRRASAATPATTRRTPPGLRCFAVALRYCQPAQDAISASVPVDAAHAGP